MGLLPCVLHSLLPRTGLVVISFHKIFSDFFTFSRSSFHFFGTFFVSSRAWFHRVAINFDRLCWQVSATALKEPLPQGRS